MKKFFLLLFFITANCIAFDAIETAIMQQNVSDLAPLLMGKRFSVLDKAGLLDLAEEMINTPSFIFVS